MEAIRQRVDIVELVREFVPSLRRAGRAHKACCPFHQEKTPSFTVNPERQIFHCFGCQEGGDVFTFLMKMEGLNFSEAVAKLGERAGVRVAPSADSLGPREKEQLRMREALAFAREFYAELLKRSPEAGAARRYLDGRKLSPEMRERFAVGFALPDGSSFLQAALRKGFAPDLLAKAGLLGSKEQGRYYDYFRGRILFAITNPRGETVGFGARAMGDAQPKYLNSPDTPVFSKGRVLYGLFEGLPQVRKARRLLLLEGYMDVLAAHQFGFTLASAPLGTAVTPDHAALIKRYADEVVFLFDPDNAGAAAALRGAELLLSAGLGVRIATVPDALDPDELLHRDGAKALEACLDRAQDLPDFQAERALAARRGPLAPQDKSRIAQSVLEIIRKAPDEILKAEWARRLAQKLSLDEESILSQMRRGQHAPLKAKPQAQDAPMSASDRDILRALFQSPELAMDEGRLGAEDLSSPSARRILASLRAVLKGANRGGWTAELLKAAGEDAPTVSGLLVDAQPVENPAEALDRIVANLRLLKRYRELHARMLGVDRGEAPIDAALAAEYGKLLKAVNDRRLLDRI